MKSPAPRLYAYLPEFLIPIDISVQSCLILSQFLEDKWFTTEMEMFGASGTVMSDTDVVMILLLGGVMTLLPHSVSG